MTEMFIKKKKAIVAVRTRTRITSKTALFLGVTSIAVVTFFAAVMLATPLAVTSNNEIAIAQGLIPQSSLCLGPHPGMTRHMARPVSTAYAMLQPP